MNVRGNVIKLKKFDIFEAINKSKLVKIILYYPNLLHSLQLIDFIRVFIELDCINVILELSFVIMLFKQIDYSSFQRLQIQYHIYGDWMYLRKSND